MYMTTWSAFCEYKIDATSLIFVYMTVVIL